MQSGQYAISQNHDFLSEDRFHLYAQFLLEASYLTPLSITSNGFSLPKKIKENLYDGFIEREIHGAMHACRVSLYTEMLHKIFSEVFPGYVSDSLKGLTDFFGLNESKIILLTRYAALGHDMGREGEASDRWEKKSAKEIADFMMQHDVEEGIANLFGLLAEMKDKPYELKKSLLNYPENILHGMDYLRRLIKLGDCFDIIRCTGEFQYSYVESELGSVPGFDKDKHNHIFWNFSKQIYSLLQKQHDQYFPVKLIGPGAEIYELPPGEADYSNQFKVRIEHASNTYLAVRQDVLSEACFTPLLSNDSITESKLYDSPSAFNPFIHGTTSKALALMGKTGFFLQGPIDMVDQYGVAPLGGELTGGGLRDAKARCLPCFGRLGSHDENFNEYTLKKIINRYTQSRLLTLDNVLFSLKCQVDLGPKILFSNINIILIYAARYRQLGGDLSELPFMQSLESRIQSSIGIFYFLMLIGHGIEADYSLLDSLSKEERQGIFDAIYTHYSSEKLIDKFSEIGISLHEIYKNPDPESIRILLNLVELPKTSVILTGMFCTPEEKTLTVTQLFRPSTKSAVLADRSGSEYPARDYGYLVRGVDGYQVNSVLEKYIKGDRLNNLQVKLLDYIDSLSERFLALKKLLQEPFRPLEFKAEEEDFRREEFPVVLIYNQDSHMRIIDFGSQEYRAQRPLELGSDITMVATDTPANARKLIDFFERHGRVMKIVLFEDLEQAKKLKVMPACDRSYDEEKSAPKALATVLSMEEKSDRVSSEFNTFKISALLKDVQRLSVVDECGSVNDERLDGSAQLSLLDSIDFGLSSRNLSFSSVFSKTTPVSMEISIHTTRKTFCVTLRYTIDEVPYEDAKTVSREYGAHDEIKNYLSDHIRLLSHKYPDAIFKPFKIGGNHYSSTCFFMRPDEAMERISDFVSENNIGNENKSSAICSIM